MRRRPQLFLFSQFLILGILAGTITWNLLLGSWWILIPGGFGWLVLAYLAAKNIIVSAELRGQMKEMVHSLDVLTSILNVAVEAVDVEAERGLLLDARLQLLQLLKERRKN